MPRFHTTVKTRLVVSVVLLLALAMGALALVLTSRSGQQAERSAYAYAEQLSANGAAEVQRELSQAIAATTDLAAALDGIAATRPDRRVADAVQRRLLETHEGLLGVWTAWEPQAFDGADRRYAGAPGHDATGRYVPYWHRDGGEVKLTALADYATPGPGDYYLLARDSGKPEVLEPYQYEIGGEQVLITSVAVPVLRDGKAVGVAGVDVALASLQEAVAAIRPYGTGRATLVSTDGALVAGGDADAVARPVTGPTAELARRAVAAGGVRRHVTTLGEREVVQVAAPVRLGEADTWSLVVGIPTATVLAEARALQRLAVVVTLAALLLAGLAALAVARTVVRPLERLRDRMAEIADGDGDLTQRVAESPHDELGQLGAAFNRFVDKVAGTVRGLVGAAGELTAASDRVNELSTSIAGSAGRSSTEVDVVSAAAEQVSRSVQTVATGAEEMGASIREIAAGAAEAARVARSAVEVTASTGSTVSRLGESSAEIGSVLKVITSIAEQTNLLALNATIEAARAGESGKGFAVVANEVKELAQETSRATEDIGRRVAAIQADSDAAVTAIAEIAAVIGRVDDHTTTIAGAVEEQTATTTEMSRSVSEAATGTTEIASSITGVARAATATAGGARDAQTAAADLADLSVRLRDLVGAFRV